MQKVKLRSKIDRRKLRIRKKVSGTSERPRLSIFRSNKYTTGQIIDDVQGITLVGLSMNDVKALGASSSKEDAAKEAGKKLAELAKEMKIDSVVFDRNGYKYHGRVKAFAEGAREGGLNF